MATKKSYKQKSELLFRYGIVTNARIDIHIHADRLQGTVYQRKSNKYVDVTGEFIEPLFGISKFSILTFPDEKPVLGETLPPSIGSFSRVKPTAQAVIELSPDEFQNLLLLATSGCLRSCYFAFTEPYRGRSLIVSFSFGSGPPGE